jgi:hypothetical protein
MAAAVSTGKLGGMTTELPHTMRELHSRTADGIHVRLLWNEQDGQVMVAVADNKAGDGFTIDVRDGDRALDVFHHPFAYAAWRTQPAELLAA